MLITHIEHSGFAVELEQAVLIFDWYTGELPGFDRSKTLYVFVSHKHADHYGSCIWALAEQYPKVEYILFHDVARLARQQTEAFKQQVTLVKAHETYRVGALQIETLLSTDEGVAFLVEAEGRTIYHAGDLNLWYWEGEPEEDNRWQLGTYCAEIDRLRGRHIDVAFLTLDPRQEKDAPRGIAYFMQNVGCDHIYPMHYWNRPAEARAYLDDSRLRPWADKFCFDKTSIA